MFSTKGSATAEEGTALEVTDLRKSFGGIEALRGINLTLQSGQLLALLGHSGCGKSTFLRCIAGLEQPTSGIVRLGGKVVDEGPLHTTPARRNLGMVFQSYALWPHMTVLENTTFGLRARKVPKARAVSTASEILDSLDLGKLLDRRPDQLSGGQQQRVALARALAGSTSLILFDEPLSNLDASLRVGIRRTVRHAQAEFGFGGIWVTHDQEEALAVAESVAVISDGTLLGIGEAAAMFGRPPNAAVAQFLGDNNLLEIQRADQNFAYWPDAAWRFQIDPASDPEANTAVLPADSLRVHLADNCNEDRCNFAQVLDTEFKGSGSYLLLMAGNSRIRALVPSTDVAPGDEVHVELSRPVWVTHAFEGAETTLTGPEKVHQKVGAEG
ncbi:ABC transporter ATP-binding protein [Rhodococcus opacus]|uniref:ABC transporter ATP-binding protein n=1 Tax=Rhodococcus opacus TaxID=37919 RepID=UPI002473CBCA|nr:ABC transporter ATP-binding protein [Rhodococcus opacus]